MPLLLFGPWLTSGAVFVCFLAAVGMTVFWIFTLAQHWQYPTILTKIVGVFAMLFQVIFAAQSLATAHSVHKKIKKISFGVWSLLGLSSIGLDMLFFGMFVSYYGFDLDKCLSNDGAETGDLAKDCDHRIGFVGLSVAIFATAVWRLLAILIAWHFNVRWNSDKPEKPVIAPAPTTISTNSTAKLKSLPKRYGVPSIAVSQHSDDEQVQLFPAPSSKLRAKDFEVPSDSEDSEGSEDFERRSGDTPSRRSRELRYDV